MTPCARRGSTTVLNASMATVANKANPARPARTRSTAPSPYSLTLSQCIKIRRDIGGVCGADAQFRHGRLLVYRFWILDPAHGMLRRVLKHAADIPAAGESG